MRPSKANAASGRTRGLVVAALLALSPLLAQCDRERPAPETPSVAPTTPAPPLAAPAPAIDRAGLIAAASAAASLYASGERPQGGDPLVGRAFVVRSAFGCGALADAAPVPAAAAGDGLPRAAWGANRETVQLSLTPGDWAGSALLAAPGAEADWEAVEGHWLPWPWLTSEACPTVRSDPLQAGDGAVSPQTVGLAAVFGPDASRLGRRNGRAYAFTVRGQGDGPVAPPPGGYRLVLEGRLVGFPDGRAFRCRASGPEQRPVCVAAVQLGRVAFTSADGAVLTEWRGG